MKGYKWQSIVLLLALVCIQGAIIFGIVQRGNRDFIANIAGSALFWVIYTAIEQWKDLRIHLFVRAAAIVAILSDSLLGYYFNLYVLSWSYDRVQHMFGTYAMALFCYAVITHLVRDTVPSRWLRCFFVIAIGTGAGAGYEILEFLSDSLMSPQIPNQPGLLDTDLDLVSNLVGALIAGIHSFYVDFGPRKQKS